MRPRPSHGLAASVVAAALGVLLCAGSVHALSLPVEESDYLPPEETTTYVERSLNRQAPLTIEHPPVPPGAGRGRAAMAGFCHDAGVTERVTAAGAIVVRQRETCENVAPRTLWPGHTDVRPAWPARTRYRGRVLSTKG